MKITCPYCKADTNMPVTERTQRFKCGTCGSRVIVDVRVKRGGKSPAVKRHEKELERLQREAKDAVLSAPGCTCAASNIRVKANAHGYYADHTAGCMLNEDPAGAEDAARAASEHLAELHELAESARWTRANELWELRNDNSGIPTGDRDEARRGWVRAFVYQAARMLREGAPQS